MKDEKQVPIYRMVRACDTIDLIPVSKNAYLILDTGKATCHPIFIRNDRGGEKFS